MVSQFKSYLQLSDEIKGYLQVRLDLIGIKPLKKLELTRDNLSLPLADNTVDFIFSNLAFHFSQDLNALFKEIGRLLNPDGLLLFSILGPDTYKQLQLKIQNPFYDMHDIGDAILASGLTHPVMDRDILSVDYQDLNALTSDIKTHACYGLASKELLFKSDQLGDKIMTGKFSLSYEVIYGHALGAQLSSREEGEICVPVASIKKS
ncbi:MAG: methyltransferase domain-containing protein [Gammaproteobacteria bacterium]